MPQIVQVNIKPARVLCRHLEIRPLNRKTAPIPHIYKGKATYLTQFAAAKLVCLQAVSCSHYNKLREVKTKGSTKSRKKLATLDAVNTKCRYRQLKLKRRTKIVSTIRCKLVLK